jgi:alcohol dehydrogenase
MNTAGGFGEYIRVPAEWAVPLPEGLTMMEAAALGTAGLTAGLCVKALLDGGVSPKGAPILVTGATGGVGALALGILARLGYTLEGVSGKESAGELLRPLTGELQLYPRESLLESPNRPLLTGRWQGAVDSVGGSALAGLLRSIKRRGTVAACGNAGGGELSTTVYPFILRGVRLQGIDSAETPVELKEEIWRRLAGPWKPAGLESLVEQIGLTEIPRAVEEMLRGRHAGRTVIALTD